MAKRYKNFFKFRSVGLNLSRLLSALALVFFLAFLSFSCENLGNDLLDSSKILAQDSLSVTQEAIRLKDPGLHDITNNSLRINWYELNLSKLTSDGLDSRVIRSFDEVTIEVYAVENTKYETRPDVASILDQKNKVIDLLGDEVSVTLNGLTNNRVYYVAFKIVDRLDGIELYRSSNPVAYVTSYASFIAVPNFESSLDGDVGKNYVTVRFDNLDLANSKRIDGTNITSSDVNLELYYIVQSPEKLAPSKEEIFQSKNVELISSDAREFRFQNLEKHMSLYVALKTRNATDASRVQRGDYKQYTTLSEATTIPVPHSIFVRPTDDTKSNINISWDSLDLQQAKTSDGSALSLDDVLVEVYYLGRDIDSQDTPSVSEIIQGSKKSVRGDISEVNISNLLFAKNYYIVLNVVNNTDRRLAAVSPTPERYATAIGDSSNTIDSNATIVTAPKIKELYPGDLAQGSITVKWDELDLSNSLRKDGSSLSKSEVKIEVYYLKKELQSLAPTVQEVLAASKLDTDASITELLIENLDDGVYYYVVLKTINTTDTSRTSISKDVFKYTTYKYRPSSKSELTSIVATEINTQGSRADLNIINTIDITDMSNLFASRAINCDVSLWDVRNVTNMSYMFFSNGIFNSDISKWNVGNVTYMNNMFHYAKSFNRDIGDWNVSNVTNMSSMFRSADVFDRSLNKWNTGNVTGMSRMFSYTDKFNSNISDWDVSNVTHMDEMFFWSSNFNQDLSKWNTGNVTTMKEMFYIASLFNSDISQWDVSKVDDMRGMFGHAMAFNRNLSSWKVNNVKDMAGMFAYARDFNYNLDAWADRIGKVTEWKQFYHIFHYTLLHFRNKIPSWCTQAIGCRP